MARRTTVRFLVFSAFLLTLLYVVGKTSTYGLSREAQVEALRRQFGGWGQSLEDGEEKALVAAPQYADNDGLNESTNDESRTVIAKPPALTSTSSTEQTTSTTTTSTTSSTKKAAEASTPTHAESSPSPSAYTKELEAAADLQALSTSDYEQLIPPKHQKQDASKAKIASIEIAPQPRNYTRALVVARTVKEIAISSWIHDKMISEDAQLTVYPYTVDLAPGQVPADRTPENNLCVMKNKGHEAMVYLTYMIDHYNSDDLADVVLFMHAHRYTWHNNDLLDSDAINLVTRLSTPKVLREGYFNLRCHLDPGCPDHLHPATKIPDPHRPEEMLIGQAWGHLFPGESIPEVLSQPCCSQFALSKDMIRSVPLATYERMRNWLIDTNFHDQIAGRVFEYVWQKLFTGRNEWCPVEHVCYCDGYGICFGDEHTYDKWFDDRKQWRTLARDYGRLELREKFLRGKGKDPLVEGPVPKAGQLFGQPTVSDEEMKGWGVEETRFKMGAMKPDLTRWRSVMDDARRDAFLRGNLPRNRAVEAGRVWEEGDGF